MSEGIQVKVVALSNSDALGYLGQQAVSEAVADGTDYRIVGGHMVRLLLHVYPTRMATLRSTLDADAAVGNVEVVGPISQNLLSKDFTKKGGNVFYKEAGGDQRIEINVLLSREGPTMGLRPQTVSGVGQVDTLPELRFALGQPALFLDIEADLGDGQTIAYRTQIPDLEAAVVLKAHSWDSRRSLKDLVDLHSLLEIRQEHQATSWRLNDEQPIGFRKDTARILTDLAEQVVRRNPRFRVPDSLSRPRMAALIKKHIS